MSLNVCTYRDASHWLFTSGWGFAMVVTYILHFGGATVHEGVVNWHGFYEVTVTLGLSRVSTTRINELMWTTFTLKLCGKRPRKILSKVVNSSRVLAYFTNFSVNQNVYTFFKPKFFCFPPGSKLWVKSNSLQNVNFLLPSLHNRTHSKVEAWACWLARSKKCFNWDNKLRTKWIRDILRNILHAPPCIRLARGKFE